jgi:hypothetical protein
MKSKTKVMAVTILNLVALPMHPRAALAQSSGSHGGDGLVFEFTGTANNLADKLISLGNLPHCPAGDLFKNTVSTDPAVSGHTDVSSAPIVLVDFVEQDAANDSTNHKLILNRSRLVNLTDPLAYVNVVMHEYFGILKWEGTNDNSKSLACLSEMQKAGVTSAELANLIFRISPITTFEQQFAIGRAAIQCGASRQRFMYDFGKNSSRGYASFLRLDEDGFYHRLDETAVSRDTTGEILTRFKSEYSVQTGLTTFTAVFRDFCNNYLMESYDHQNWSLRKSWFNPSCYFYAGSGPLTNIPVKVGMVSYSNDHCTNVYFQDEPVIISR